MSLFSRLRPWQKGFLFGLLFVFFIDLVYVAAMITFDIILKIRGSEQFLCLLVEGQCTFASALGSKLLLFFTLLFMVGIPVGLLGAALGYIIQKIGIR